MAAPNKSNPFIQPPLEVKKIRKRIDMAHQTAIDALIAQIALLQRYFMTKGVPAEAARELDEFFMDVQDRWTVAAETIEDILERGENLNVAL